MTKEIITRNELCYLLKFAPQTIKLCLSRPEFEKKRVIGTRTNYYYDEEFKQNLIEYFKGKRNKDCAPVAFERYNKLIKSNLKVLEDYMKG